MSSSDLGEEQMLTYLRATASMLDIPLPPDREQRVLQHFIRTVGIAAPLLAFSLPERVDGAGEFEP